MAICHPQRLKEDRRPTSGGASFRNAWALAKRRRKPPHSFPFVSSSFVPLFIPVFLTPSSCRPSCGRPCRAAMAAESTTGVKWKLKVTYGIVKIAVDFT